MRCRDHQVNLRFITQYQSGSRCDRCKPLLGVLGGAPRFKQFHWKENTKTHQELDEKEVNDLCGETQTMTSNHLKDKPRNKKQSQELRKRDFQAQETEGDGVAMMCWENLEGFLAEEPNEETGSQDGRADNDMEKPKYEEEHADHTLHTGKATMLEAAKSLF